MSRPSSDHEMLKDLWDRFHEPAVQQKIKELEQAIEARESEEVPDYVKALEEGLDEQAASGGALSAEQVARAIADTQGHWDKNNPAYYTVTDIPALAKSLNAALAAHDQKVRDEQREKVAAWMIANSFATGHGDSVEDLLKELKWQIKERVGKVRDEALEAVGSATDLLQAYARIKSLAASRAEEKE